MYGKDIYRIQKTITIEQDVNRLLKEHVPPMKESAFINKLIKNHFCTDVEKKQMFADFEELKEKFKQKGIQLEMREW